MSEPRNTIDALLEGMKDPCFKTNDLTSVVRREELLERAIETLYACEAVQKELAIQIERGNENCADLHQRLTNEVAENAMLQRRLQVAVTPGVDAGLHFRYVSKKWLQHSGQVMGVKTKGAVDDIQAKAKRSHAKKKRG